VSVAASTPTEAAAGARRATGLRILMLAPQPFYQERGTPIAIDLLLRVLSADGHEVHVLTFPGGEDRSYPGVRIERIRRRATAPIVGPGFSLAKLRCDLGLMSAAWRCARDGRYDVVHAVEEAAFIAEILRRRFGLPYVYDMDSLLSMQMLERFPRLGPLSGLMRWAEALPVRRAVGVVPMCDALAREALRHRADGVVVVRDISLIEPTADQEQGERLRERDDVRGALVMYIGNLEAYQGIGLLLEAFARACERGPEATLVIIGGSDAHIDRYRAEAARLGVAGRVVFTGPRPVSRLGWYAGQADVLVSPRVSGSNTPMKIYSYLGAGVALLATRLPTHTQVLDDSVAVLAEPQAPAFGDAMAELLAAPGRREVLAEAAARRARDSHSFESFREGVRELYAHVATAIGSRPQ